MKSVPTGHWKKAGSMAEEGQSDIRKEGGERCPLKVVGSVVQTI